jgi:hypothetical protein
LDYLGLFSVSTVTIWLHHYQSFIGVQETKGFFTPSGVSIRFPGNLFLDRHIETLLRRYIPPGKNFGDISSNLGLLQNILWQIAESVFQILGIFSGRIRGWPFIGLRLAPKKCGDKSTASADDLR